MASVNESEKTSAETGNQVSVRSLNTGLQPKTDVCSTRLFPPIGNGEGSKSGHTSGYRSPLSSSKNSRYHSGCVAKHSLYLDWGSNFRNEKKKTSGADQRHGKARSFASLKDVEEQEKVSQYLEKNKEFLESYVINNIPLDVIERWVVRKKRRNGMGTNVINNKPFRYPLKEKPCEKQIYMNLLRSIKSEPDEHSVLWELVKCLTTAVGVDAFRVYKLFPDHANFVQCFVVDHTRPIHDQGAPTVLTRAEPRQVIFVLETAKRGSCLRVSRSDDPHRFPETPFSLLRAFKVKNVKSANHVMYLPILTKSGKAVYVVEMWKIGDKFKDVDEETSSNFIVWGSFALHYSNLYLDKAKERNMSDFLLDVVKAIFEEMVSLDQLIKRILEFAQRLVNADRASLFLVDYRNFELVSTVFDLKFDTGLDRDMEKKEIRMPINRGIAGHVALSGETMNIPDAYSDYRFNREVDEATGYKTVSILCMPVKVEGRVIGVVQMVNKRNDDNFGHDDEVAFEIFSTFFGLALHHARLYDRIMRKEQKYRVALEVLSYHNTCKENEVQAMLTDKEKIDVDLDNYYLDPFRFNEFEKCKCVIIMFNDLFNLASFDVMTLTRFVLTVKKNYRTVPYHNFDHGWTVAHSMYVLLKNDVQKRFDYKMRLALFVACLCHDLDHRGYTNKYMNETASPLAAMYTTSTLEHHHFNITVTILQQDGHNIFSHMSSEDYKEILGFIRQSILATDLAAFFPNLDKIKHLHNGDESFFNWDISSHRDLAMAISMTAADLSASAKPWEIQIKTVKVIFEEFYDQGDKERAAGREPIPMMDRNKPDEQPSSQVGFLSQICIPCYSMLYKILPNTKPMYAMAMKNLERWKSRAERILRKIERKKEELQQETEKEELLKKVTVPKNMKPKDKEVKVFDRQDSKSIVDDVKNSTVEWEEEEDIKQEEIIKSGIWKKIEGEKWIDDGVEEIK